MNDDEFRRSMDDLLDHLIAAQRPPRRSQARLWLRKPPPTQQVMPRVKGKPFRCSCRANVFTKQGDILTCNGCGARYQGIARRIEDKENTNH